MVRLENTYEKRSNMKIADFFSRANRLKANQLMGKWAIFSEHVTNMRERFSPGLGTKNPLTFYPIGLKHRRLILELKKTLESVITGFQVLCRELKGMESRWCVHLFSPFEGHTFGIEMKIWEMNSWLYKWHQRTGFGSFGHNYANKITSSCSDKVHFMDLQRTYFSGHSLTWSTRFLISRANAIAMKKGR